MRDWLVLIEVLSLCLQELWIPLSLICSPYFFKCRLLTDNPNPLEKIESENAAHRCFRVRWIRRMPGPLEQFGLDWGAGRRPLELWPRRRHPAHGFIDQRLECSV